MWVESDAECTKNPQQMHQRGQGEDTEEGFVASVGGRQWYVLLACVHVARDCCFCVVCRIRIFHQVAQASTRLFLSGFPAITIRSDPSGMCGGVGYFRKAVIRVRPTPQRARS